MSRVKVSEEWINLAAQTAERMMDAEPKLREAWYDQNRTSKTSNRDGMLALRTDHDWVLAFFVWERAPKEVYDALPRDP